MTAGDPRLEGAERLGNVIDSLAMQPLVDACDELATRARDIASNDDVRLDDLKGMLLIRRTEEELGRLAAARVIRSNLHSCVGQEAVCVGAVGVLCREDYLTSTYRGRGHAIAKGVPLGRIVAEVMLRETGLARGLLGPMHMVDSERNLLFQSAIVGGAAPIAVGAALSAMRRGAGSISMTVFGDGATAQGTLHEALNLAGAWAAPVVFVLENNGYSEMTPTAATSALADFSWRSLGHGIPSLRVDGNSVVDVRAAATSAVEWARGGRGPVLIEAVTYRLMGHYAGDPGLYRPETELEAAFGREPVLRAERRLLEIGVSAEAIRTTHEDVEREVADAVEFALASAPATPKGTWHVYKEAI
jgi:acetoin:2,6-dichlorophenolindophenol oxidoreductase subunit alpha